MRPARRCRSPQAPDGALASWSAAGAVGGRGRRAHPGAGAGLVGLAERVSLADGELEHGADEDGDYVLRAPGCRE